MRNILLTIAIVLAACINGILAYDISSISKTKEITVVANHDAKIPAIKVPEVKEPAIDEVTGVIIVQPEICYPRHQWWAYRPLQPVRNLIRFFHNRQPVRSWIRGYHC